MAAWWLDTVTSPLAHLGQTRGKGGDKSPGWPQRCRREGLVWFGVGGEEDIQFGEKI